MLNMTSSLRGPAYSIERIPSLYILGPSYYNIKEGEELALICKRRGRGEGSNLFWRKKVRC